MPKASFNISKEFILLKNENKTVIQNLLAPTGGVFYDTPIQKFNMLFINKREKLFAKISGYGGVYYLDIIHKHKEFSKDTKESIYKFHKEMCKEHGFAKELFFIRYKKYGFFNSHLFYQYPFDENY